MGRSIALTLAREGASVVVNYRNSTGSAAAIVDRIRERGGTVVSAQADVTDAGEYAAPVGVAEDAYGKVDIRVIGRGGGWHPEPVDDMDPVGALDDAHRELAPPYNLMPLVLPGMYERGWGRLIGISQHPRKRSPAYAYNVGKAAGAQALLLAEDPAWRHGVTVNAMAPGPVAPFASLEVAIEHCDHGPGWLSRSDVTPQDIAEGVALLCSDAGRFIAGSQIVYGFA